MNNYTFVGRLTKQPELSYIPDKGTPVCNCIVAIKRTKTESDFISLTVYGKNAENLVQYMTKGSLISGVGEIRSKSYTKEGVKVYTNYVYAKEIRYLESRGKSSNINEHVMEFVVVEDEIPYK
jgi:single-strand DNA-binding protein